MKRATSWLLSPQLQVFVAVVGLAILAGWSWSFFWGGPKPYSFVDIDYYRTAVLAVIDGSKSMYEAMAYPPFAYLLLWWLASTPPLLADQIWTVASLGVIIVMAGALAAKAMTVLGQNWRSQPWELAARTSLWSLLVCVSMPIQSQITCGQLSLLVIALPLLDLVGVLPERFRGILIGLAAAIKVTPMIFAVYYLVTGQYRKAANAGVSFVGFTALGAIFFPAQTWEYWTRLGGTGQDIDPLLPYNLGIRSDLARISPDLANPTWLWAGLGLLLMVLTLWRARAMYRRNDRMEAALIVAAAAIVVPPNALPHYFTWLPLIGVWLIATAGRLGAWLGAAIFLMYSAAWLPLAVFVDQYAPAVSTVMRVLFLATPILLGIFGLPRRSDRHPGAGQADPRRSAAAVTGS